ncbi:sensory box histidine kinase [Thermosipho africanus H17ap60334]|uniref:GGDEF domain-containing protein n=1 Tax=Thermosipho africanus TaxID=2421 RepID=UPI00028D0490|nr:sensor domain-containing diguanylate cyclase [Thermosipho africanus]EKF48546.1 sensory box histidine kinase [Thermosipho africanus H17ap60334]
MIYFVVILAFFLLILFLYFWRNLRVLKKVGCFDFSCKKAFEKNFLYRGYKIFNKYDDKDDTIDTLKEIFDFIVEILEAQSWSLLLTPKEKKWRFIVWNYNLDDKPLEILGELFQNNTPYNLSQIISKKRYYFVSDVLKTKYWKEVKGIDTRSWCGIPLVYNGEVYAILNVDWYRKKKLKKIDKIIFDIITEELSNPILNILRIKERLEEKNIDLLTGLYNRGVLDCIDNSKYNYLIFLDLDNFKEVNDSFGHLVGDEVLRIISRRLKNTVKSDDLIIRYGGDEFIILVNSTKEGLEKLIQRIKEHVSRNINIQDKDVNVGVSIGYCMLDKGLENAIRIADKMMYKDKNKN